MSELIRREDLENWLRTECASIDTYEDKEYVIGRLREDLPTVNQWHRVEEEMPKSGEFAKIVLACNDVGTVKAAYLSSNGKWYAANNTDWDGWTWMPNVTHWMPFPEPPKEDDDMKIKEELLG